MNIYSRDTYRDWREAGCPPEAAFPEGARSRVAKIAEGDILLAYLSSRDSAFFGVQEVVSRMRDSGSLIWGDQYPLTVGLRTIALLEADKAVRYLSLEFLPTMAGRREGQIVPSRGRVGRSATFLPYAEGERIVDAVFDLVRGN